RRDWDRAAPRRGPRLRSRLARPAAGRRRRRPLPVDAPRRGMGDDLVAGRRVPVGAADGGDARRTQRPRVRNPRRLRLASGGSMNVVVAGGSGLIGRALVASLLADGHGVTVLTRDPDRARKRLPPGCAIQAWDGGRDPEAVVDLAA